MFIETSNVGPSSAVIPTQLSAAMASGYILWILQKTTTIPWISQTTAKLNAFIRLVVAGVSSVGISIAWSGDNHQLIIGNLTFAVIMHGLWHVFTQYAATHGFEKLLNIIPSTSVPDTSMRVPTTKAVEPKNGEGK